MYLGSNGKRPRASPRPPGHILPPPPSTLCNMSHPIAYPDLGGRFWYFESGGGRLIWRKAIDLESHAQLIAFCTWSYGKALSWPTTRSVCSDTFSILRLPWMWMRNQSCEPSLAPQHQRCDGCGWLTLASHVDAVSCVKCNRFAVDHYTCHRCSVWSPNGRICYICVSERESGCIIGNHSNVEMQCLNEIADAQCSPLCASRLCFWRGSGC